MVLPFIYNTIKDPHWYAVQGSDTTMMTRAASLPGQSLLRTNFFISPSPLPKFYYLVPGYAGKTCCYTYG